MKNKNWTREELLACFNLYCRIPFGKLHSKNPKIIAAAVSLRRTPGAVAMKLVNFASFDPVHRERNIKGLSNVSRLDRVIWAELETTPNKLAAESEAAYERLLSRPETTENEEISLPSGITEKTAGRKMRLVQNFFRRTVLASYGYRCSFCNLEVFPLLNASHIIPWSASVSLRADPRNGLCLCALHDRAFDRGLLAVDRDFRLLLSKQLKIKTLLPVHQAAFLDLEGKRIELPDRFLPMPTSLEHHRTRIFKLD